MKNLLLLIPILMMATACGKSSVLGNKTPPDETQVVDGPSLSLPPSFDLRPPSDGSSGEDLLLENRTPEAVDKNDSWLLQGAGPVDEDIRRKLTAPTPTEAEESGTDEDGDDDGSWWKVW